MAVTYFHPGFLIPKFCPNPRNYGSHAFSAPTIQASNTKVGMLFQIPKSGTLDKFEWRTAPSVSINASSVYRCSFQDQNASRGPDGTQDEYRDIAGSVFSANSWIVPGLMTSDGTDSGTKRSVSKGDLLWAVIEPQTFTAGDRLDIARATAHAATSEYQGHQCPGGFPQINAYNGSAWVGSGNLSPYLVLKYSDGTYEVPVLSLEVSDHSSASGSLTVNWNSGSNPDERGILFQVKSPWVVDGAIMRGSPTSGGNPFDVVLYDSGGSAVRTVSFTKEVVSAGQESGLWAQFSSNYTMTINSNYRLAVKPGASNFTHEYVHFPSEAVKSAVYGSTYNYTYRTDGGSWTNTWINSFIGLSLRVVGIDFG